MASMFGYARLSYMYELSINEQKKTLQLEMLVRLFSPENNGTGDAEIRKWGEWKAKKKGGG